MTNVNTRDGIFNGGGYGGGVFDGTTMGFGGLGTADAQWAVAGLGKLTAPDKWTIGPNEWPSTVSAAVVKSGSRWKELAFAGSGLKVVTVNGQQNLSPWKVGQVVQLPASWVPSGSTATPVSHPADTTTPILIGKYDDRVLELQFALNSSLMARKSALVPEDGILTATACAAIKAVVADVKAGHFDTTVDGGLDKILKEIGTLVASACPSVAAAPPPVVGPIAPTQAAAVCNFEYGDAHPQVSSLQSQLNSALDKAGYKPISVTGVYDAATCGAIFTLGGSFKAVASATCPSGWIVPLDCPDKSLPKKKDEPGGTKTGTATAWMLGGLVGAAALAGLYFSKKR